MIILDKVTFSYPEFSIDFDLTIEKGEKVGVVGPSGSGKSTLLNLIAGFAFTNVGEIRLNGHAAGHCPPYQRPVSMLFQENNLFEHLTVAENMGLGLKPNLKLSAADWVTLKQIAQQVGLGSYLSRLPAALSGGQKQRVALARCLLRHKPILLLDEPFSALDKPLRAEMLQLVQSIAKQQSLTILMVTHQPEELVGFIDRFIHL